MSLRHERDPALDGIRGCAVLLVLMSHLMARGDPNRGLISIPFKVASAGWIGVDLFFVLSGFLITSILWRSRSNDHYFRNFYMRRVLRIFPLYYGSLAVVLWLLPHFRAFRTAAVEGVLRHQLFAWAYLLNFAPADFRADWLNIGHFWSLAIEEQFYFVWPIIIFRSTRQRAIQIAGGALALSIVARGALQIARFVDPHLTAFTTWANFDWTPCRFDGLAVGALIALLSVDACDRTKLARLARPIGLVCAGILAVMIWRGTVEWILANGGSPEVAAFKVFGFAFLAVLFGAVVVEVTQPASLLRRVMSLRALRFFGKYSYGLYVFHGLLMPTFEHSFPSELMTRVARRSHGRCVPLLRGYVRNLGHGRARVVALARIARPAPKVSLRATGAPQRPLRIARSRSGRQRRRLISFDGAW